MSRQGATKETVHTGDRVADRHRMPSIPMVSSAYGGEVGVPPPPSGQLVLDRHLKCHLDRYGATIGVEESVHALGKDPLDKQLPQLHSRAMCEAPKHYVS